jgi:hypothetical protein
MARERLPEPRSERGGPWRVLGPVLGVAALLAGLVAAGQAARDRLRAQDRYTIPFVDIDCPAPAGQGRADFLSEVQYLAEMPGRLPLLDGATPDRLARAFALHPWVEGVRRIEMTGRRVKVHLSWRTPVLAVVHGGRLRAVDRHGVLLPTSADPEGLPLYCGAARVPNGLTGMRWADDVLEAVARSVGSAR